MSTVEQAKIILNQIYEQWDVIYEDEEGKHRLPINRNAIEKSNDYLAQLDSLDITDKELLHEINDIRDILHNAVKRKFNFSFHTFIAMAVWLIFIIIMGGVLKSPDWMFEDLSEDQILRMKAQDIKKTETRIAGNEADIEKGFDNYYKEKKWSKKEKKESWNRIKKDLKEDKKHLKAIIPMNAKKFEKYSVKYYGGLRRKCIGMTIFYLLSYIAYLYASMRPNYLYWKNGKSSFGKIEASVGGGIASAAFTALYTVPYATVEKTRWSNGMITKATTNFGMNIFVSGMILVLLLGYFIFIAMTVPYRAVANYLRNYVLYI